MKWLILKHWKGRQLIEVKETTYYSQQMFEQIARFNVAHNSVCKNYFYRAKNDYIPREK